MITEEKTIDALGPQVSFMSSLDLDQDAFALALGVVNPGVVVPLHAHADREVFSVIEGVLDVFIDGEWRSLQVGETVDVRDGAHHAWRNSSAAPAKAFIGMTVRLGQLLLETGRPLSQANVPPSPQDLQKLVEASMRHGFWLGSPEDNAEIGLSLPG